jgi:hypothetical protein
VPSRKASISLEFFFGRVPDANGIDSSVDFQHTRAWLWEPVFRVAK